ncbi:MAG: hypothetical protein Q9173_002306 [Seirophora scorigena]
MAGKKAAGENTKKAAGNAKATNHLIPYPSRLANLAPHYRKQKQQPRKPPSKTQKKPPLKKQNGPKAPSRARRGKPHPSFLSPPFIPRLPHNQTAHPLTHIGVPHREEAEAKKADLARKKAEKDAVLAAEEASAPSGPKNKKTAPKKTSAAPPPSSRALNLDQLDEQHPEDKKPLHALNATGIDNALDALSLTAGASGGNDKVEKHPERRFKAAYAAFEARRMPELEAEMKGLRRQQRIEVVRKEFEKSAENPFNQVRVDFDASKEEVREAREKERVKVEARLGK